MPIVGLRARWAMPVLAFLATRSKIAVPVVSDPVPAVVGTATRGESGFCDWQTLTKRGIDEVKELGLGKIGVEVHEFRCVDDAAASDCKERVWSMVFREVDRLLDSERRSARLSRLIGLHAITHE